MSDNRTKYCAVCKEQRPVAEFWKNKSQRDGLDTRCKPCSLARYRDVIYPVLKTTEKFRTWKRNYQKRYESQQPAVVHARSLAQNKKSVIKKNQCEECGATSDLHMHHHDYDKPLDVKTLCRTCHVAEHKRMRAA